MENITQKYIEEVFDITMNIYKNAFPEIIAEAFDINEKDVPNLTSEEIKKRLNNLQINYKIVNNIQDEHIWYHDLSNQKIVEEILEKCNLNNGLKEKIIFNLMGREYNENECDELRMHLYEEEQEEKSVEEIKNSKSKEGISKILSDINYISHEMTHAFDHLISKKNPSKTDFKIELMVKSKETQINKEKMMNFDLGESFAISMELLLFDELKKKGNLEKYGLSKYIIEKDIDNVWNKKRGRLMNKLVGETSSGKLLSQLDLDLFQYRIMKNNGIGEEINFLKNIDFMKYLNVLKESDIRNLCDLVYEESGEGLLINEFEGYKPIYSEEKLLEKIHTIIENSEKKKITATEIGKFTINISTKDKKNAEVEVEKDIKKLERNNLKSDETQR